MFNLMLKKSGFIEVEPPKTLTADDFIAEVKCNGFTPIMSTLKEDGNFFYVFSEEGCWVRGAK